MRVDDALLLIRDELRKATNKFGAMAARFIVDMTPTPSPPDA